MWVYDWADINSWLSYDHDRQSVCTGRDLSDCRNRKEGDSDGSELEMFINLEWRGWCWGGRLRSFCRPSIHSQLSAHLFVHLSFLLYPCDWIPHRFCTLHTFRIQFTLRLHRPVPFYTSDCKHLRPRTLLPPPTHSTLTFHLWYSIQTIKWRIPKRQPHCKTTKSHSNPRGNQTSRCRIVSPHPPPLLPPQLHPHQVIWTF